MFFGVFLFVAARVWFWLFAFIVHTSSFPCFALGFVIELQPICTSQVLPRVGGFGGSLLFSLFRNPYIS